MTTFVSSDWHLGHKRIPELAGRPFKSIDHMNSVIINNWNERVMPDDQGFVLGDVVMGSFEDNIKLVNRFNGKLYLVPGNHDRVSSVESFARCERFLPAYEQVFENVLTELEVIQLGADGPIVNMSHYPYNGDSHDVDRFEEMRPKDSGHARVLLHGHTHSKNKISRSRAGTLQIHVGIDAWDYYPASEEEIIQLIKENL